MNRYPCRIPAIAAMFICSIALVPATSTAEEKPSLEGYQQHVADFGADDRSVRSAAQSAWQTVCFTLGNGKYEAQRKEACGKMGASLIAGQPRESALFLLRQLERIGLDESVSPLLQLTSSDDAEVADAARRALQNNRSGAARDALVSLLEKSADQEFRIRIINSLGYRADAETVNVLAKQLGDESPAVQLAAAKALSRIDSSTAAGPVIAAWKKSSGTIRDQLADSVIVCANTVIRQGDGQAASAILNEVYSSTGSTSIRAAAFHGQLAAAGDNAAPLIVKALNSDSSLEQQLAVGHIRDIQANDMSSLLKSLSSIPPVGRAAVLVALGSRREKTALPAIRESSTSKDPVVQIAAVTALGEVGTAADTQLLLDQLSSSREIQSAAAKSLGTIFDDGVDKILIQCLNSSKNDDERDTLIGILNARRTPDLAGIIVASNDLVSTNVETRKRATGILSRVGDESHISALIASMTMIAADEQDNVAKTIVSICDRIPSSDAKAAPVVKLYSSAAEQHRPYLLSVAGRIGGKAAGDFIGSRLTSRSATEKDAAITALSNWPDDSVSDQLLSIAKSGDNESQRIRALRALARVIVLPTSQHSRDEQLAILKQAMTLATRDDERKLILDRVKAIGELSTVQFVRAYLNSPTLGAQAESSLVHLARIRELRQSDQTIRNDLERVMKASSDQKLRERAKQFLAEY